MASSITARGGFDDTSNKGEIKAESAEPEKAEEPEEEVTYQSILDEYTQKIKYFAHKNERPVPEPAQKYLDRLQQLQTAIRRTKRQIARDQKRVEFLQENYDMFRLAEHHYLYGNDL